MAHGRKTSRSIRRHQITQRTEGGRGGRGGVGVVVFVGVRLTAHLRSIFGFPGKASCNDFLLEHSVQLLHGL